MEGRGSADPPGTRPESSIITLLVTDSQRLFSGALGGALAQRPEFLVLDLFPSDASEIVKSALVWKPDVALVDNRPGIGSIVAQIISSAPDCKVLVLSGAHSPVQVQEVIGAGAVGFLPKSASFAQVIEAIHRAHDGEVIVMGEELQRFVELMKGRATQAQMVAELFASLSPRELQVLISLSSGLVIKEVANQLSISPATVTAHINHILRKVGAKNHQEAVAWAQYSGTI